MSEAYFLLEKGERHEKEKSVSYPRTSDFHGPKHTGSQTLYCLQPHSLLCTHAKKSFYSTLLPTSTLLFFFPGSPFSLFLPSYLQNPEHSFSFVHLVWFGLDGVFWFCFAFVFSAGPRALYKLSTWYTSELLPYLHRTFLIISLCLHLLKKLGFHQLMNG